MDIVNLHNEIINPTNYIIDIGASTGIHSDPVYPFLIDKKYSGLCIEGNKAKTEILRSNTSFDIYDDFIYPHNVLDVFQRYNVPRTFDILKIDIDGYDLEVIRVILSKYNPKIIIAEINEKIPPPILFEVKYKEDYVWDESHFYGFSIQSAEALMSRHDYAIIQIHDLSNIVCVKKEVLDSIPFLSGNVSIDQLYRVQYIHNFTRFTSLPWNESVNYWLELTDQEKLKNEIIFYFCNANNRSTLKNKMKILGIDFLCHTDK